MRHTDIIFASLLKPISRRRFRTIVERCDADAYDKTFKSWDHFVALAHGQLSGASSLRGLVETWNVHAPHHYHLGTGPIARSTLADANARRPPEVFAELFTELSQLADRRLRREAEDVVRLIDSSPIPVPALYDWALSNGRIRGLKLHVDYDHRADHPRRVVVTAARVNDIEIGRQTPLETGATYVFDKGYCSFSWWTEIHAAEAFFVTRPKTNTRWRLLRRRPLRRTRGDGFEVLEDAEVALASRGDSKLAMPLRRIRVRREGGQKIVILTNDMKRPAVEVAALYKARWQIELLFRWIKQHLKIRAFLGRSENAVRLQVLVAMIVFVLLRLAAKAARSSLPPLRFVELVSAQLFVRKPIERIDKPRELANRKTGTERTYTDQLELAYA
jgi:IS4 transposase